MSVFIITDIEGSTERWEKHRAEMEQVLARHDQIMKEEIESHGGRIIKHTGDGVFAVFEDGDPLGCALVIQRRLSSKDWGEIGELRVRIGLHAGPAQKRGEDFFGPVINRTARVMAAAWGGQILLTQEVRNSCHLPAGASFKDHGVHLLKDLEDPVAIYELVDPDVTQKFPTIRSLSAVPNNLFPQPTPFLDRGEEMKEVSRLIDNPECRLLTIIGPGGIGKTRIALQVAAQMIDRFRDGVYHIPLASLTLSSVQFLIFTIADCIKFTFYSKEDPKVQLFNYLREKEMLLIFDNFEHLTEAANLLSEMLKSAPKVKIIVVSRERLNLKGEWTYEVDGLESPNDKSENAEDYGAIQLFVQAAQQVKPDFELVPADLPMISRICMLVNGFPLGIELAAALVRVLPLKEIINEIEKNIDSLESSIRDVPDRHRSLRAVFNYSWGLLSEPEKEAFKKISVLKGSFTKDAAGEVAGVLLPVIITLRDKSLLRVDPTGRYEILAILRNYGLQELERNEKLKKKVSDAHCRYYCRFLADREKEILGKREKEVLDEIATEMDNIRAAWNWAVDHNKEHEIDQAANGLYYFYLNRNWYQEGEEIFRQAADQLMGQSRGIALGKVMRSCGHFSHLLGDPKKAEKLLKDSIAIFHDLRSRKEEAMAMNVLGDIYRKIDRFNEAEKIHDSSLRIYKELGDKHGIAQSLNLLSYVYERKGDFKKAKQLATQGLSLCQEIGNLREAANSFNLLGLIDDGFGEYESAKQYYLKSAEISNILMNKVGIARSLNNVANIHAYLGEMDQARKKFEESLRIFKEIGSRRGVATGLLNLSLISNRQQRLAEAQQFVEEALTISEEIGDQARIGAAKSNLAHLVFEKGDVKKAIEFEKEALSIFREIGDQWLEGMSLAALGLFIFKSGDIKGAMEIYFQAFKHAMDRKHFPIALSALAGIGQCWAKEDRKIDALTILSFINLHPASSQSVKDEIEDTIMQLTSELSSDDVNHAVKKAKETKLEEIEQMIMGNA